MIKAMKTIRKDIYICMQLGKPDWYIRLLYIFFQFWLNISDLYTYIILTVCTLQCTNKAKYIGMSPITCGMV